MGGQNPTGSGIVARSCKNGGKTNVESAYMFTFEDEEKVKCI